MNNICDILKLSSTRLKGLRAENNMSLEDVANKIGVHRETIRRYESDSSNMSMEVFIQLLNLYNVPVTIFFDSLYGKMP